MIYAVLAGFAFSVLSPAIFKISGKYAGKIISAAPLAVFIFFAGYIGRIEGGESYYFSYTWFPSMGVSLSFVIDGLSLVFALIISGAGFAVFLYASSYMKAYQYQGRFFSYLSLFMGSMIGLVTSDNIYSLFIFWELTSVSSYLLIGFNHDKEESRKSALQALLITASGGLALLAGLILLQYISGETSISAILPENGKILESPLYPAAAILIILGAFTKSAQFPFHFWLPGAMAAPTPVSAYLHSATMVKAGVFLLARMSPALGGSALWQDTLVFFGAATMLVGAFLSIKQTDLKLLLAYSTVSVLGILVMLIGMGGKTAIKAMMIYLIAHSMYKGALFLFAGIIDHGAGARDIRVIAGLKKVMPITGAVGILAALSKMGMIPFLGFIGKETLYEAALNYHGAGYLMIALVIAASICSVAVGALVAVKPMFGALKHPGDKPHGPDWAMSFGPGALALGGILFSVLPVFSIEPLVLPSASNILGDAQQYSIKLWHGFNLIFILSLITLMAGIGLYIIWPRLYPYLEKLKAPAPASPSKIYSFSLKGLTDFAALQTRILQNGYLRAYISVILAFALGLISYSLFSFNDLSVADTQIGGEFYEIIFGLVILISIAFTVTAKGRLRAIAGLGVIGFMIALIFLINNAPDLALTQFAIEMLTVILFVLALYKLPKFKGYTGIASKAKDIVLSVSLGAAMGLIILVAAAGPLPGDMKEYFIENSYVVAQGRNIVNVILVDFRALDTLGEIIVLGIAALGAFTLLKLKKKNIKEGAEDA